MPEGLLGTASRLRAIDAMRRIAAAFGDLADAMEGPDPGVAVVTAPEPIPPVIEAIPAAAVVPPTPAPKPVLTAAPAARTIVNSLTATSGKPIVATKSTILNWGWDRGIGNGSTILDLDRVNAKRRNLQLPPFEVEEFNRRGARG